MSNRTIDLDDICPTCGRPRVKMTDSGRKTARIPLSATDRIRLTDSEPTCDGHTEVTDAREEYMARTSATHRTPAARAALATETAARLHDANQNPNVLRLARGIAYQHSSAGRDRYLARLEVAHLRRR